MPGRLDQLLHVDLALVESDDPLVVIDVPGAPRPHAVADATPHELPRHRRHAEPERGGQHFGCRLKIGLQILRRRLEERLELFVQPLDLIDLLAVLDDELLQGFLDPSLGDADADALRQIPRHEVLGVRSERPLLERPAHGGHPEVLELSLRERRFEAGDVQLLDAVVEKTDPDGGQDRLLAGDPGCVGGLKVLLGERGERGSPRRHPGHVERTLARAVGEAHAVQFLKLAGVLVNRCQ